MKTIDEYIKEISKIKAQIANINKELDAIDEISSPDTAIYYVDKHRLENKLQELANTEISVGLKDMMDNFSKITNVPRENLSVSYFTNCTIENEECNILDRIREEQKKSNAIIHYVITERDANKKFVKETSFSSKMDLSDKFLDGKTMENHIFTHTHVFNPAQSITDIRFDDYSQIAIKFSLKDLLFNNNGTYQAKDAIAEAAIATYEKTLQQEQQETMDL